MIKGFFDLPNTSKNKTKPIFLKNRLVNKNWKKNGIVYWINNNTVFISVVFTWKVKKAYEIKYSFEKKGYKCLIGGPAISLLENKIYTNYEFNALQYHNEDALFTSRGCPNKCKFCAVPKIEPKYIELKNWTPKSIICDNNILASSKNHFNFVIEKIKNLKNIDFNQGLDASLFNSYHIDKLKNLNLKCIRFAWDHTKNEKFVMDAINLCIKNNIPKNKIRIYVLIGFDDSPEDSFYRLNTLKNMKVWPFPMRFQPLNSMKKNCYINKNWTELELKKMQKYFSNLRITNKIPFEEFDLQKCGKKS